jgi:hypothetical protein
MADQQPSLEFKLNHVICELVKIKFIVKQQRGRITFEQAREIVKEVGLLDPAAGFDHVYQVNANSGKRDWITFSEMELALKELDCLERRIELMVENIRRSGDEQGRVKNEKAFEIMKPYFPKESHGEVWNHIWQQSLGGFWRKSRNTDYIRQMRPWTVPEDEIEF